MSLKKICDAALIESLSPRIKAMMDEILSKGGTKKELLRRAKKVCGNRKMTVLAIEAYLSRDK